MDDKKRMEDGQKRKVLSRLGGKVNLVHCEHDENDDELVNLDLINRSKTFSSDV